MTTKTSVRTGDISLQIRKFLSALGICLNGLRGVAIRAIVAIVLVSALTPSASSQQMHVLSSTERAKVTRIDLTPGETYTLKAGQQGDVWVSVDPLVLTINEADHQSRKQVGAGEAAIVDAGKEVQFNAAESSRSQLIIVEATAPHQALTVGPFIVNTSIEDGSSRNATLLVAVSACHFRDTRNRGDESEWIPSTPEVINMDAGTVRWIRPGIHHFKNLDQRPSKLVSVEW